ncbi:hypothetical protein PIB30_104366 [Stylosanthes scabra]|uniref:Uncharacterized protein n=1 Tax=Stylosanthes scabra TaxID=79078 RepID=A0ABU6UXT4_9FABA|nr:hypothetical protein [Stylosanthes scabra]
MIYDGTITTCIIILLWDTYVIQLCGKTVANVLKEVRANNVERKDRIYTLVAMCEDKELINKYLPEENTSQYITTVVEIGGSNYSEGFPVVAKQPDCGDKSSLWYATRSL